MSGSTYRPSKQEITRFNPMSPFLTCQYSKAPMLIDDDDDDMMMLIDDDDGGDDDDDDDDCLVL